MSEHIYSKSELADTVLPLLKKYRAENVNFEHRAPLARKNSSALTGI